MSLLDQPLESITEATLNGLITAKVPELKHIEYKRELAGPTDSQKKEFLFDLSSFANADGGDIIYGMEAVNGVPTSITGLDKADIDAQILRCDQLVQRGIDARIPGLRFHPVTLANGRCVLIARVPKTWAGPHMVTYQATNKFYSRASAGKYLLDVEELRSAFLAGTSLVEKVRAFRMDRINSILNGDLSITLPATAKTVLHILPTISFRPGFEINLKQANTTGHQFCRPMSTTSWGPQYNVDGLLISSSIAGMDYTYVQVFRNGTIEAVETYLLQLRDNEKSFPSIAFEQVVVECGGRILQLFKLLEIPGPYIVLLSYTGVKGFYLHVDPNYRSMGAHLLERDNLFLRDVVIDDPNQDFGRAMRPVFDQVWNAFGWTESLNYDKDGNWRRYR